jgi:hypothetical protein
MNTESVNEALTLIAQAMDLLNEFKTVHDLWDYPRIEKALVLMQQAVDKLAT